MLSTDWYQRILYSLRFWCSCAFLAGLTSISGCGRVASSCPGATYHAGYIFADKQAKIRHTFVVTNDNSTPVKILRVERTCGCASFKLEKFELEPGEATALRVDVDVPTGYMPKIATCILKTDHPKFRDWLYTVQFIALPFAVADPEVLNLGRFGFNERNKADVKHVNLDLFGDSKVTLTADQFRVPEEVELEIDPDPETRELQRGVWNTRYQLSIKLNEKGRKGLDHDPQLGVVAKSIRLSAGGSRRWAYSVFWQVDAPLAPRPSFLSFGDLDDEGEDHARHVTISSSAGKNFKILSAKNSSSDITIEAEYDASNESPSHQLKLRALKKEGSSKARFLAGVIQVHTSCELQPAIELHWSAIMGRSVEPQSRASTDVRSSPRMAP
jgi:hypothetical protein